MKLLTYKGCREQGKGRSERMISWVTFDFWKYVNILPCQKIIGLFPLVQGHLWFFLLAPMPFSSGNTTPSALEECPLPICIHIRWLWSAPSLAARQMIHWSEILSAPWAGIGACSRADPSPANEAELGTFPGPGRKEELSPCCCWCLPQPPHRESLPDLYSWDWAVPESYLLAFLKSEPQRSFYI